MTSVMAVKGLTTSTPKKSQQHEKQFIQEKDIPIRFKKKKKKKKNPLREHRVAILG